MTEQQLSFEAAMKRVGVNLDYLKKNRKGVYIHQSMRNRWQTWQLAQADILQKHKDESEVSGCQD